MPAAWPLVHRESHAHQHHATSARQLLPMPWRMCTRSRPCSRQRGRSYMTHGPSRGHDFKASGTTFGTKPAIASLGGVLKWCSHREADIVLCFGTQTVPCLESRAVSRSRICSRLVVACKGATSKHRVRANRTACAQHAGAFSRPHCPYTGVRRPPATTCALYCKYDLMRLERVVGGSRARKMVSAESAHFMFC